MALPFVVALLFAGGCAAPRAPIACPHPDDSRGAKIFYATDRQKLAGDTLVFGHTRTDPPRLHMGWEKVVLGPGHRLGRVDDAIRISTAHRETPSPGTADADALEQSDAEIASFVETQLRPAVRLAATSRLGGRPQVLLFIHGYNTSFNEAMRNTAQMAGDLDLVTCSNEKPGIAILYSWPARTNVLSYLADEENAEWTQQRLAPFLDAVARVCRQHGAELNIVAHSMGARALVRSLAELANACQQEGRSQNLAEHVILLAPDIGKGLFDQYVERFLPLVRHLTIYVSAKDRALGLSTLLHGGHGRLGLIESTVLTALELTGLHREDHRELGYVAEARSSKVDMIDVTGSLAGPFGHSYQDPAFIRDLRELISRDTPAGVGRRANLARYQVQQGWFRNLATLSYFQLKR